MKQNEMLRLFNNFMSKAETKCKPYSTIEGETKIQGLTREEKVSYLLSALDIDTTEVVLKSEKEIEVEKLSKDYRFQLIAEAAAKQDLELVTKLSTCIGFVTIECNKPFAEAGINAQLNYLEKEYLKIHNSLPEEVEVDILGGKNFIEFIEFCQTKIAEMNQQ